MKVIGRNRVKFFAGPKSRSDRAEAIIQSNADFQRRRIYLLGEIDTEQATKIIAHLDVMDETPGPIFLRLFSVGGEVPAGFAIYDALRLAHNHITVEGTGEVSSMAAIVLQGGDHRVITAETRIMIHNVYVEMSGHQKLESSYLGVYSKEISDLSDRYHNVVAEHSGLPIEKVREMCRRETYMSAQEAVDLQIADEIRQPTKKLAR